MELAQSVIASLLGPLGTGTIVPPDTVVAWRRKLIAMKWDHFDQHGPGRRPIMSDVAALIVRVASENRFWGHTWPGRAPTHSRSPTAKSDISSAISVIISTMPESFRKAIWMKPKLCGPSGWPATR